MKRLLLFIFVFNTFSFSADSDGCACNDPDMVYGEYVYKSTSTFSSAFSTLDDLIANRGVLHGFTFSTCDGASKSVEDHTYYVSSDLFYSRRELREARCIDNPCDVGEQFNSTTGVCEIHCSLPYVLSPLTGVCEVPPVCELDNESLSAVDWSCQCDNEYMRSPFSGQCIKSCGDGTDDIDCDNVPNDQDDDIDGDGIPNDQDDDIDGDGIPNSSDDTPDGGSGGGGSDTPEIQDQCIISDINSHTSNGICVCNVNYHVDTLSNFCVADTPAEHDTSCDYEDTRNGYPFQQTTFTQSGCQYFINFWNGGSSYKKDTCDYWGCYYANDGSGDSNGTTPGDIDGDGIPDDQDTDSNNDGIDDNGTNTPTDGGLFAKASDLMGSAHGVDIDLKVSGASPEAITVSIMGHTYVIYDPAMISDSVWNTITLVMKWIAIVSAVITVFTTI